MNGEQRETYRVTDETYALPERDICPTPGKNAYPSRRLAKKYLKQAKGQGRGSNPHLAIYMCPCGRWHAGALPKTAIQQGRSVWQNR